MKKRYVFGALLLSLTLLLTGCAGGAAKLSTGTQDLMKGVPVKSPAKMEPDEAFIDAMRQFSVRLLQQTAGSGNTMVSPASVMAAMAMVSTGARGETAAQMAQAFGMELDALHPALSAWLDGLTGGKKTKLNVANSIWFRKDGAEIAPDFLQKNAETYHASLYAAEFDDATVADVNRWVKHETMGLIPQMVDRLPDETTMLLINALAFDGKWTEPFEKNSTLEVPFTQADGTSKNIPMMHGRTEGYFKTADAVGFRKAYTDGYSLIAILPNQSVTLADYLASWTPERLTEFLNSEAAYTVDIGLPKFKSAYSSTLNNALRAMGIRDAFTESADFSGISRTPLVIDQVLHKTKIEVDESGTKAAAATMVGVKCTSIPMDSETVILNRPFLYMIVQDETNLPVFLGTMNAVPEE